MVTERQKETVSDKGSSAGNNDSNDSLKRAGEIVVLGHAALDKLASPETKESLARARADSFLNVVRAVYSRMEDPNRFFRTDSLHERVAGFIVGAPDSKTTDWHQWHNDIKIIVSNILGTPGIDLAEIKDPERYEAMINHAVAIGRFDSDKTLANYVQQIADTLSIKLFSDMLSYLKRTPEEVNRKLLRDYKPDDSTPPLSYATRKLLETAFDERQRRNATPNNGTDNRPNA